jgi:hypothetical protein
MVEITETVTGPALMPLPPVRPRARRVEAGIALSWLRRTRIDGDSWELAEVPLGEETECYELRILDGDTVIHAEIVNEARWLYPVAQEFVDFGAPQAELAFSVAQISATVGRGREWHGRIAVG